MTVTSIIRYVSRSVLFWFILVVVAATMLNFYALNRTEERIVAGDARQGQSLYVSQLRSCKRANSVREGLLLALDTAAASGTRRAAEYAVAAQTILDQPFTRSDGTVNCRAAVLKP